MSEQHVVPVRLTLAIFAALMALLAATVGAAYMPLGRFHLFTALAIAVIKTLLIILYFMHVRYGPRMIWVCSGAATVWLAILIVLTFSDYSTRDTLGLLGK